MTVVKMKKTTILSHKDDVEEVVEALQEAGVVHVIPLQPDQNLHLIHGGTDDAIDRQNRYQGINKALYSVAPAPARKQVEDLRLREVVEKIEDLVNQVTNLERKLSKTEEEITELKHWGDFKPEDVIYLQEKGIRVTFTVITRQQWQVLDKELLAYAEVREDDNFVWAVFFGAEQPVLPVTPLHLPQKRLARLIEEAEELHRQISTIQREIGCYTDYAPMVRARMDSLRDEVAMLRAIDVTHVYEPLVILQGYVPVKESLDVQHALQSFQVACRIEDPAPDDDVPVMLKNNWVFSGFEAVLKTFSGIAYHEKDITWMVGLLFILFGSLCLLDAGYALLLLITGVGLKINGKEDFARVFMATGAIGIPIGLISGQAFGLIVGKDVFPGKAPLVPLAADPLSCFIFSLVVGALAMGFSYAIAIWQRGLRTHALGNFILVLALCAYVLTHQALDPMLTLIKRAPDEQVLVQWAGTGERLSLLLIIIALICWFLFPDAVFGKKARVPNIIWTLYSGSTGLVQDILSHMRLFGIALSGSILALVVNKIGSLFPLPVTIVFAIFGHIFVYVLALLSLYIHANRLIFLEVGSKCIDGGNRYYNPLRRGFSS